MDKKFKYTSGCLEVAIPMMDNLQFPLEVACFDTETTGIKATENFITQLSVVKVVFQADLSYEIQDSKGWLIKPPIPVPKELEDLHIGPTNEDLKDAPSWEEIFPEIESCLGENSVLLAHNTPFDLAFMEKMYATTGKEFKYQKAFDSLVIARAIYLDKKNHKLGNLVNELDLKADLKKLTKGRFHDSDTDVMATILLFRKELSDWEPMMRRKKVVPFIADCFQFNSRVDENGNVVQVNHLAFSTRFYTTFGETRYTHVPREWAADFDLGLVNFLRFEQAVLKYTGCQRIADIKKFDPKEKKQQEEKAEQIAMQLADPA